MKTYNHHNLFRGAFLFASVIAMLLLTRCTNDAGNAVASLMKENVSMTNERDSLLKVLEATHVKMDTLSAAFESASQDNIELEKKIASVRAGYRSRGEVIKKMTQEKEDMSGTMEAQVARNDSLQEVIESMQGKMAELDRAVEAAREENALLSQSVKVKEQKIITDSIAEVQRKMKPVEKDYGFVDIAQVGGAFGLGDVSPDYSRSLISVENIFGYQVNRHFITGIGTGLHFYNGGMLVPLFADSRFIFGKGKINPMLIADGGLMINPKDLSSSGIFFHPAFGLGKKLTSHSSFVLSIGPHVMNTPGGFRSSFIVIKGGVSF